MIATDAAWVAGIVDGEGCISAVRTKSYSLNPRRRSEYNTKPIIRICLSVVNTDRRMVDALVSKTNIGIVVGPRHHKKNPRAKPRWEWKVGMDGARVLLPQTMPWLVCKRERAEIALQILALKEQRRSASGDGQLDKSVYEALREQIDQCVTEMTRLNLRGVAT